jgi:hypothetical protein
MKPHAVLILSNKLDVEGENSAWALDLIEFQWFGIRVDYRFFRFTTI